MPHIVIQEIVVVAAAVVLFYLAPAALACKDEFRRRRLLREETLACARLGASEAPSAQAPEPEPDAAGFASELQGKADAPASATTPSEVSAADAVLEIQPLAAVGRYRFRLQDLRRTQLPDWPPAVVRHDAERQRMWQEAERIADQYRGKINEATILSPYPARAFCLGAAEVDGPVVRLRYLLFPSVWPVSENQAVAEAVFEIDRGRAEVRGWVDALHTSELSEENRREIQHGDDEMR